MFCFAAFADNGACNKNEAKTLVLKYDDSIEGFLKASTALLHRNTPAHLHLRGDVGVTLLGEKKEIFIPEIKESFLFFFNNTFSSAEFHLSATNQWFTLETSIKQIQEMKSILSHLSQLAINEEAFDISQLTKKCLDKQQRVAINIYQLKHYKIVFILKKFNIPREIIPHEGDYFQLYFRVLSNHS